MMAALIASALRTKLLADVGVAALVGTRIHASRAPEYPTGNLGEASIVFRRTGGGVDDGDGRVEQSVDVRCYASTDRAAMALYETTRDALRSIAPTRVVVDGETIKILACLEMIGGQDLVDPDGPDDGWTYTLGQWRVDWIREV